MAKKFLRRYLPDPEKLRHHRSLRMFGHWLQQHPDLWHLNRRSVSIGLAIGLFWAFVPMPLQMIPSTAMAVLLRGNIPAAIGGAWVTNPFTIGPAIVLCYQIGAWILGVPVHHLAVEISWTWFTHELAIIWQPYLLGCLVVSVISSALGYFGVQLLWRWQVVRTWERRKKARKK